MESGGGDNLAGVIDPCDEVGEFLREALRRASTFCETSSVWSKTLNMFGSRYPVHFWWILMH